MAEVKVTKDNFQQEVLESDIPVIIVMINIRYNIL